VIEGEPEPPATGPYLWITVSPLGCIGVTALATLLAIGVYVLIF
jgi:hypothetical protein